VSCRDWGDLQYKFQKLLTQLKKCAEYELILDAMYYWAICLGSSGAERSFYLKYGRTDIYILAQRLVRSLLKNELELEVLLDLIEQSLPNSLTEGVKARVAMLDNVSRRIVHVISRLKLYECLKRDSEFLLEYSIAINNVMRKLLRNKINLILKVINDIVSTGLLISCAWSPYEGLPHLYVVPKYSLPVWYSLQSQ